MTVSEALLAGAGLGLIQFGGLWMTVPRGVAASRWLPLTRAARLGAVGLGLYGLGREGAAYLLAGLGGWLAMRSWLLVRLGGAAHG